MIDILSIQEWLYLANVKDYDMMIVNESGETLLKIIINDDELDGDALDNYFSKIGAEIYFGTIYISLEE